MDSSDPQPRLILWGYVIKWATLFMPPAIILSMIYVLVTRGRLMSQGLRSHADWRLTTVGITAIFLLIVAILFVIGMSGVNTDAPVSIIATFTLLGLATAFPIWYLYRLLWGSIRFARREPMERLLP
jgi:uncharacterized membrane protein